jgi:hypothetical protein
VDSPDVGKYQHRVLEDSWEPKNSPTLGEKWSSRERERWKERKLKEDEEDKGMKC